MLVAVVGAAQVALLVSTHVIASPFANVVEVNVALLVPVFTPFFFHWYEGVDPPLVGVAVNVTLVPAHMVEDDAAMLTDGVRIGLTVIVMFELDAEVGDGQVAVDTIVTEMMSPLVRTAFEYAALLVPTVIPFLYHW